MQTSKDYLNTDQIHRLLEVCGQNLRPIVLLAVNTGMRWGELQRLEWRDVDFENRRITVRDTKNGETRHVRMNDDVMQCLKAHRSHQTKALGSLATSVFLNGRRKKPYNDIRKPFKQALEDAGIDRSFRFHDLRHTAASQMVMAGVDLRTVGWILGHKTPQMTLRYAHLSDEHLLEAADKLQVRLRQAATSMDTFATPTEKGTGPQSGALS